MRLADPLWLLAAVLVLAAAFVARLRGEGRRSALTFPGAQDLPESAAAVLVRTLPHALKAAALLLAVVAMARPQRMERHFGALTQGIDIMLSLDTSTSMLALDFDPADRMTAAKETARGFVAGRLSDRIGLVVFGGAPVLACPLTLDYEALLDYLGGVEAGMTKVEGTAIGDGIAAAVHHLRASQAKSKVIILLTDGSSNAGAIDPPTAAQAAKSFGIRIYAIGTGRRGEAMIPMDTPLGRQLAKIPDELDEETLVDVAEATQGKYFRATNRRELSAVFSEIDLLEKSDVKRPSVVTYHDLHAWLLIPAALLLLAEAALSRTWLLRLP